MDVFNNLFSRKENSKNLLKPGVKNRRAVLQFVAKTEWINSDWFKPPVSTGMRNYPFRLGLGVKLISTVNELLKDLGIESMFVVSCIGKISHCSLKNRQLNKRDYDIPSLTVSFDRSNYSLMKTFANCQAGSMIDRRVHSLTIAISCELILAEPLDCKLNREFDPRNGDFELFFRRKQLLAGHYASFVSQLHFALLVREVDDCLKEFFARPSWFECLQFFGVLNRPRMVTAIPMVGPLINPTRSLGKSTRRSKKKLIRIDGFLQIHLCTVLLQTNETRTTTNKKKIFENVSNEPVRFAPDEMNLLLPMKERRINCSPREPSPRNGRSSS